MMSISIIMCLSDMQYAKAQTSIGDLSVWYFVKIYLFTISQTIIIAAVVLVSVFFLFFFVFYVHCFPYSQNIALNYIFF